MFIFERLPVSKWRPTVHDFERIRKWLLNSAVNSEENKLSRILLANINYHIDEVREIPFVYIQLKLGKCEP